MSIDIFRRGLWIQDTQKEQLLPVLWAQHSRTPEISEELNNGDDNEDTDRDLYNYLHQVNYSMYFFFYQY